MSLTSPHIFYDGSTAYDLREVTSWSVSSDDPTIAVVRFFTGNSAITVQFDLSDFETAKQTSLDNGG
jgi:hypothetical protein